MEKEIINKATIQQDLKWHYTCDIRLLFMKTAAMVFPVAVVCFVSFMAHMPIGLTVLLALAFLTAFGAAPIAIFRRLIYIHKIKQGNFLIKKDRLTSKKVAPNPFDIMGVGHSLFSHLNKRIYHLYFAVYGKFTLFIRENYTFSESFFMTGKGIYDQAKIGEDFYVVLIGKRKVPMNVYSTAFFTLQEEG
ncbi:MAG: hypothetical protein IJC82_07950 [Firmicutes bacterium]|nr:hypothetical protein [Bacillota bacterium]